MVFVGWQHTEGKTDVNKLKLSVPDVARRIDHLGLKPLKREDVNMKRKKLIIGIFVIGLLLSLCSCSQKSSQSQVIGAVRNVNGVQRVEQVIEGHDPNNLLNRQGGYTACVYFSVSDIDFDQFTVTTNQDAVDVGVLGGGCVEIYKNSSEAKKRNEYLSTFDNTLFDSGSHERYGSLVIRISNGVSGSRQQEIARMIKGEIFKDQLPYTIMVIGIVAGIALIVVFIVCKILKRDKVAKIFRKVGTMVLAVALVGSILFIVITGVINQNNKAEARAAVEALIGGFMTGNTDQINHFSYQPINDTEDLISIANKDSSLMDAFQVAFGYNIPLNELSGEVQSSYSSACDAVVRNYFKSYSVVNVSGDNGVYYVTVEAQKYDVSVYETITNDLYSLGSDYAMNHATQLAGMINRGEEYEFYSAVYNGVFPGAFATIGNTLDSAPAANYRMVFTVETINGNMYVTSIQYLM